MWVNASVVATGGHGADFIVFMRKDDSFEDASVEIRNGHNCIVRLRVSANQSLALQAGHRTIRTLTFWLEMKETGVVRLPNVATRRCTNPAKSRRRVVSPCARPLPARAENSIGDLDSPP